MKLTLAEPKLFKDSIAIISELVSEGRFKITKNAIELVAMDPANVAMVIFRMFSSTFTEYNLKEEVEMAINLSNLKQIVRRAGQNDMLTLELEEGRLKIILKGRNKRTFTLPTIEIEDKQQKVPDLKFPVSVDTICSNMVDAVDDADIVSDSLAFVIEGGKFFIEAEGDMNRANIDIPSDDDTKIKSDAKGKVRAKYSIDYLKKMIQSSKLTDKVKVQFNTDYPLKMDFISVDKVQMSFVLAPRVENKKKKKNGNKGKSKGSICRGIPGKE